jgi:hypothetical protein
MWMKKKQGHVEAQWICEGCGDHVIALNRTEVPAHQLCNVCAWLCEHIVDPKQIEHIRRTHGWIRR